jgi:hypothetical protein
MWAFLSILILSVAAIVIVVMRRGGVHISIPPKAGPLQIDVGRK